MIGVDELRPADDLFVIALDHRAGRHTVADHTLRVGLAGGLLIELIIEGCIQLAGDRLQVTDMTPGDSVTLRILEHLTAEPEHTLRTWLLFIGKTAVEDIGERLVLRRLLRRNIIRRLLGSDIVRWAAPSDRLSVFLDWRGPRLTMKLGAGPIPEFSIATLPDASLVALCHAMDLTTRLLRDAGPDSHAYVDQIHRQLADQHPAIHTVAQRVGELVGTSTFTH
ncbi:GPP34 family phosphoprotein [Hamadaea sp. NPDC051192]|uniref:GPP34 family phosphoprotein n=1 Tax=Hamadaea sp. NPDC051192 TaxID=3154940 RepID=UPI00343C77A3